MAGMTYDAERAAVEQAIERWRGRFVAVNLGGVEVELNERACYYGAAGVQLYWRRVDTGHDMVKGTEAECRAYLRPASEGR